MLDIPYFYRANIKGRGGRHKERCEGSISPLGNQGLDSSTGETWGLDVTTDLQACVNQRTGSGGLRRHVASQNSQMKEISLSFLAQSESHGLLPGASTHGGVSLLPVPLAPCGLGV